MREFKTKSIENEVIEIVNALNYELKQILERDRWDCKYNDQIRLIVELCDSEVHVKFMGIYIWDNIFPSDFEIDLNGNEMSIRETIRKRMYLVLFGK